MSNFEEAYLNRLEEISQTLKEINKLQSEEFELLREINWRIKEINRE